MLKQRPDAKPDLLAWRGAAKLYRAILALQDDRQEEFEALYGEVRDTFAEARKLKPQGSAVVSIVGGSYAMFADRLPEQQRAKAWSDSYDSYQVLWKQQKQVIDKLPVHFRGELLAGLAQSAQRTGREEESAQRVAMMVELLKDTPYERAAKRWQKNPEAAATSNLTCKSCHAPGRLAARLKTDE